MTGAEAAAWPTPPGQPELFALADPDLWPDCLLPGAGDTYLPAVDWPARHQQVERDAEPTT